MKKLLVLAIILLLSINLVGCNLNGITAPTENNSAADSEIKATISKAYQLDTLFGGFCLPYSNTDNGYGYVNKNSPYKSLSELNHALSAVFTQKQVTLLMDSGSYYNSGTKFCVMTVDSQGEGPVPVKSIKISFKKKNTDGSLVYSVKIALHRNKDPICALSSQDVTLIKEGSSYKVSSQLGETCFALPPANNMTEKAVLCEKCIADYVNTSKSANDFWGIYSQGDQYKPIKDYIQQLRNDKITYKLISCKTTAVGPNDDCQYDITTHSVIQFTDSKGIKTTKDVKKVYTLIDNTQDKLLVKIEINNHVYVIANEHLAA